MNLHPTEIKDLERLQKYERIFKKLLKSEDFAKPDIWASGESKGLIGMVINALIEEGSIIQNERGAFRWDQKSLEAYKKEWLASARSTHQVKRLRKEERPREKLLKYGASKLTTADLVAIFLRSGVKGKSALLIANELLTQFGGVKGIFEAEVNELLEIQGLGEAKVAQIKAVEALAEVYLKENMRSVRKIKSSKELFDYLYLTMRDAKREVFKVIEAIPQFGRVPLLSP